MCARRLVSEVVTVSKMCVVGYSGISGVFLKSILSIKTKSAVKWVSTVKWNKPLLILRNA